MYINEHGIRYTKSPSGFYVKNGNALDWSLMHEETRFKAAFHLLMDKIPEKYFGDIDTYIAHNGQSPIELLSGGLSPEFGGSKTDFEIFISKIPCDKSEKYFKTLYVEDIRDKLNFLFNKIMDIKYLLILFYIYFGEIPEKVPKWIRKNDIFFVTGPEYDLPFTILESIFQKMHSVLDLCVKMVGCLDFEPTDYCKYYKIKVDGLLWDQRKKFSKKYDFSPIENYEYIKILESLRNEFTHNGSWEACRRVYVEVDNGKISRHWIYLNDHENGTPCRYVNRTRFYSKSNEVHINVILPSMVQTFMLSLCKFLEGISLCYVAHEKMHIVFSIILL